MIQSAGSRFILYAALLSVASILLYAGVLYLGGFSRASYDGVIFGLIFLGTITSYFITIKIGSMDPSYFMIAIMCSIVLRLLLYTAANIVIIYLDREKAIPNVILFFCLYLLFTVLETLELFKIVRAK